MPNTNGNLRIVGLNLHDTATLEVTSEEPTLPISYTQRSERALVWRSTNADEQVITGTLASGSLINTVAIIRHNLGAGGLRRIELLVDDDVVYDSGLVPTALLIPAGTWRAGVDPWGATYDDQLPGNLPQTVLWLPSLVLATSYRITVTGGDEDGYIEIGRIMVGEYWSPEDNMSWSPQIEWRESGEHLITEGGSLRTVGVGDLRREIAFDLDWLAETDRSRLISLLGRAGMGADLLISLYPGGAQMLELEGLMVCRRRSSVSTTHNRHNNWRSKQSFTEV